MQLEDQFWTQKVKDHAVIISLSSAAVCRVGVANIHHLPPLTFPSFLLHSLSLPSIPLCFHSLPLLLSPTFLPAIVTKKGKGFPILDTERWARSWSRCTGSQPAGAVSHPPGGRLPLLSARPVVTSPAAESITALWPVPSYTAWRQRCKQLAQGCYAALPRVGFDPATYWSQSPTLYSLHYRANSYY